MSLDEAKHWLGARWVLHPAYQPIPHHSNYALVNVGHTFDRVRNRMRTESDLPPIPMHRVRDGGVSMVMRIDPRGTEHAHRAVGVEGPSFTEAVEKTRQRLRIVHGGMTA